MEEKEPKKHLTSAERHALYEARAASSVNAASKKRKRKKILRIILCAAAVLLLAAVITGIVILERTVWKPARTYAAAEKQMQNGEYLQAYDIFVSLGSYSDSQALAEKCILENAKKLTGRDDALIAGTDSMPWFSIDETGALAFDKDLYAGDGNIVIPDIFDGRAVTALRNKCFFYADFLLSVRIPATVTSIGERAFFACSALKEISLPNSVTFIDTYAFGQCTALETAALGTGLTTVSNNAFMSCSALKEIVLPEGVTEITPRLFNNCSALESISIPSTVTSVGTFAFTGCDSLKTVRFSGTKERLTQLCNTEDSRFLLECENVICSN